MNKRQLGAAITMAVAFSGTYALPAMADDGPSPAAPPSVDASAAQQDQAAPQKTDDAAEAPDSTPSDSSEPEQSESTGPAVQGQSSPPADTPTTLRSSDTQPADDSTSVDTGGDGGAADQPASEEGAPGSTEGQSSQDAGSSQPSQSTTQDSTGESTSTTSTSDDAGQGSESTTSSTSAGGSSQEGAPGATGDPTPKDTSTDDSTPKDTSTDDSTPKDTSTDDPTPKDTPTDNPTPTPTKPAKPTKPAPKPQPASLKIAGSAFVKDTNGSGRRDAGDTVTFRYTVTNSGKGKATGLVVSSDLGAASCGRTTVPSGGTTNCTVTTVISQADMERGAVTDRATATAMGEDGHKATASSGKVSVTLKGTARLNAVQSVTQVTDLNRDGHAGEGDKLRYSLRVTNTGSLTVKGVAIVDGMLNRHGVNFSCPTTTLAPGATTTCTSALYTVTRWQAKHSPLTNRAYARGTTLAGATVASNGTTTYRLTIAPAPRVVKHRSNKSAPSQRWVKKAHAPKMRRHHVKPHKVRLVAKIRAAQWLSKVTDKNHNGRLDAGDSVVYSFKVVNSGNLSVSDLAIVDRKLARKNIKITCDRTTLVPGATAVCHAQPLVFTKWQAKHNKTLGKNWAYATAVASTGKEIRSNATVTNHGRKIKVDPEPNLLAYTGLNAGSLVLSGVFLMGIGGLLKVGSRRRRRRS